MDDWRTKFRSLRKVYSDVIHGKKHIQNKLVMDQLDFLRPLIGKRKAPWRNQHTPRTSERAIKSSRKNTSQNDAQEMFPVVNHHHSPIPTAVQLKYM